MSKDWWSRKLTNPTAPPPSSYRPSLPPTQAPIRFPVHVPSHAQPSPPQQVAGNQRLLDPNRAPTDNISMGEAIKLWKGGEATRREGGISCPSCGSHLMFARERGRINGASPAPRCFECGYNGIYDQADQSNWG